MKTYLVDGQPVKAESDRHAVKYYASVLNRMPDVVEDDAGNKRDVYQLCESTGLGIFCDDERDVHYEHDSEAVYWLTEAEQAKMRAP
jgi:protein tyrosine phosphatase (PTP) superfamily phosphohydrolase (DUF442 family)